LTVEEELEAGEEEEDPENEEETGNEDRLCEVVLEAAETEREEDEEAKELAMEAEVCWELETKAEDVKLRGGSFLSSWNENK
jgi:hypothetical protein